MQLSNLKRSSAWYFIFGAPEKSSLANQFANEHKLVHLYLKSLEQTAFREHINNGLVVECSTDIFRAVESLKQNIIVVILEGKLTDEEISIKNDYQKLGRCITLKTANYKELIKELYPKLIVLFGPNRAQIIFLCQNYFNMSGFVVIDDTVTANDLVSRLPKQQNYILTGFIPRLTQLTILEQYFNIQVIHLKHQRNELSSHEQFFILQSNVIPKISNKSYYHCISGNIAPIEVGSQIGKHILPELIFVNTSDENQRKEVDQYVQKSDSLLLSMKEIENIFKKQQRQLNTGMQRLQDLVSIIFRSSNRKQVFLIDYPQQPEQFFILKDKTRPITLFADCLKASNYNYSKNLTPSIHFLQNHARKHIQADFSFEKQILKSTKYIIVNGPPCVGKTSAAKYISSSFGYKHIEYEPYIASVKEKLIAPEDGQDLPFHKIIKHFNSLIVNSGENPILIDGLNLDWKDLDNWVSANGPPIVFNLKAEEKELIRRTRRKNEADVNAEVTEQQAQKAKQVIAKNNDWADQLGSKCPAATLYQIDFSPQLIKAEKLLDEILKPRVFLVQQNLSFLYQNIALKYNLGYFDLKRNSLREIAVKIRQENYRNVILNNYNQLHDHLVCQDFHQIEKLVGNIRYLAMWNPEPIEAHQEKLHLQAPLKVEKPKPAEGEEGGEAPPAEQEGQVKKKVFNVYDYTWTKTGKQKNISQWLFKLKKNVTRKYTDVDECFRTFQQLIKSLSDNKELTIYDSIVE